MRSLKTPHFKHPCGVSETGLRVLGPTLVQTFPLMWRTCRQQKSTSSETSCMCYKSDPYHVNALAASLVLLSHYRTKLWPTSLYQLPCLTPLPLWWCCCNTRVCNTVCSKLHLYRQGLIYSQRYRKMKQKITRFHHTDMVFQLFFNSFCLLAVKLCLRHSTFDWWQLKSKVEKKHHCVTQIKKLYQ